MPDTSETTDTTTEALEAALNSTEPLTLNTEMLQQLLHAFHKSQINYHQHQISRLSEMNWDGIHSTLTHIFTQPAHTQNELNHFATWLNEALLD